MWRPREALRGRNLAVSLNAPGLFFPNRTGPVVGPHPPGGALDGHGASGFWVAGNADEHRAVERNTSRIDERAVATEDQRSGSTEGDRIGIAETIGRVRQACEEGELNRILHRDRWKIGETERHVEPAELHPGGCFQPDLETALLGHR